MNTFERFQVLVEDDPKRPGVKRYWRVVWANLEHAWIVEITFARPPAWPEKRIWAEMQGCAPTELILPPRYACIDPPKEPKPKEVSLGNFLTEREVSIRDQRYKLISSLITQEAQREIWEGAGAGKLVQAIARGTRSGRDHIYDSLKVWMMLAGSPNALIPWDWKCGAPGQEREAGTEKRGRTPDAVLLGHDPERTGINTQEAHKQLITNTFIEEWHPGVTFRDMIRLIFKRAPTVAAVQADGTTRDVPPPPGKWLTKPVIRYWVNQRLGPYFIIRRAVTPQTFNLTRRGLGGCARDGVFYPTQRFEIDSTILDLYLVSAQNRANLIGRPVVYLVVDVFSGAIVGFHVALSGPDGVGAKAACFNAFSNKEPFLRRLGLLGPDGLNFWPMHHAPSLITADRGEMFNERVKKAFDKSTTILEFLPGMRGDLKPYIEILFRIATDTLVRWLPGAVRARARERNERGRRDWRLDACLTIFELNVLLAKFVRFYNATRDATMYAPPEALEDGLTDLTPGNLYQWGLANQDGAPAALSRAELIPRFLEPMNATVARTGIYVGPARYGSETADQEHWTALARHFGSSELIVYNEPVFGQEIFWQNPKSHRWETFHRLGDMFRPQATLWDVADDTKYRQQLSRDHEGGRRDSEHTLREEAEGIVAPAKNAADEAKRGVSKKSRTAGVEAHRAAENESMHGKKGGGKKTPASLPDDFDTGDEDLLNTILSQQAPRRKAA